MSLQQSSLTIRDTRGYHNIYIQKSWIIVSLRLKFETLLDQEK